MYHLLFDLETIEVSEIIMGWLIFEKKTKSINEQSYRQKDYETANTFEKISSNNKKLYS